MKAKDEKQYQHDVVLALEAVGFKVQEHDEKVRSYVPDLSFAGFGVDGWIELKWLNETPKCLRSIKHFTRGQYQWLKDFGEAGFGHCYLWIGGVSIPHIVINHQILSRRLLNEPFEDLMAQCTYRKHDLITAAYGLIEAIK